MSFSMTMSPHPQPQSRLVPSDGKVLPLEAADLRVDAKAGLARVTLSQRFRNPHAEPLSVSYRLPLPADAAVSGFVFRIGERSIRGVVEGRSAARELYEAAILDGRSAALLEEDRSSLFTQEIGNIPPGASVVAEIEIDQPLAWLAEGSWEWRFPLAAAPRYLGCGPSAGDVTLDVATGAVAARASLSMSVRDPLAHRRSPESPSHPLQCTSGPGLWAIELGSGNRAHLDRDVVVRWPVAAHAPGLELDVAMPEGVGDAGSAYGLLTLVPPSPEAAPAAVPRDLTLLLDTSGSMGGEPLEQMKRVACALVDSLTDRDTLGVVEFSFQARAFLPSAERATPDLKRRAMTWIRGLAADGGTEMVSGVHAAMRELRPGSQRQIVMITDGLVGFERDVVAAILKQLPDTARFHVVGVGSAVNRSLLLPVARAGRGVEAIVGLGEDPERAAQRVLTRTAAPVLVDLVVSGPGVRGVSPARLPDCFAGAPARVALELAPEGGEVVVRGRLAGAPFEQRLRVGATKVGAGSPSVAKLYGRERVEDVEMRLTAGEGGGHDAEIERLGKDFGIATRLTSFVAVTDAPTVDPRAPTRHETQPQALPYGMSAEGLGLRSPSPPSTMGGAPSHFGPPIAGPAGGAWPAEKDERPRTMGAPPPASYAMPPTGAPPPPPAPPRAPSPAAPGRAAPPAPATKRAKGEADGLFERVRRTFLGRGAPAPSEPSGSADEVAAERATVEEGAAGAARSIEATIAMARDARVVLELVVPEDGLVLAYEGATVTVRLADGTEVAATVAVDLSTHEATYGGGVVLRVAVELERSVAPFATAVEVWLPKAGVVLRATGR